MHLIQILLSLLILIIGLYVFRKFRNSIVDIVLFFGFLLTGLVFIMYPELTTKIAKFLGVGRGADMVFYLAILFFTFVSLKLYERLRGLEKLLHKIIREKAIDEAKDHRDQKLIED